MKWNRFERVLEASPWLQWHIGSPYLQSLPLNVPADEARRQLREYIRTRVNYVAFRPFALLDLASTNVEDFKEMPNSEYRNVRFWMGWSVRHVLRFHIEGPDKPFERIRYIETSIADSIRHLVEWHGECWAKQNCELKLDAIVKVTSYSNDIAKFGRQEFEVYKFPVDFNPQTFLLSDVA